MLAVEIGFVALLLLLASGASGVSPSFDSFATAVTTVAADLARQLIGDAEGASKDIEIRVQIGRAHV